MKSPDIAFWQKSSEAADTAFRIISEAQNLPIADVHRKEVCLAATSIMLEALIEYPKLCAVDRLIPSALGFSPMHSYLVFRGDDYNDEIVVDPTWQQFLPTTQYHKGNPKVLYGSRREILDFVNRIGVSPPIVEYWKPLHDAPSVTRERVSFGRRYGAQG